MCRLPKQKAGSKIRYEDTARFRKVRETTIDRTYRYHRRNRLGLVWRINLSCDMAKKDEIANLKCKKRKQHILCRFCDSKIHSRMSQMQKLLADLRVLNLVQGCSRLTKPHLAYSFRVDRISSRHQPQNSNAFVFADSLYYASK